jgi:competence protein ComEA
VLDPPSGPGDTVGAQPPVAATDRPVVSGGLLRILATAGGTVACAIVAFVLAVGSGSGDTVLVGGASDLPVLGASGAASGLPGGPGAASAEIVVEVVGAVPRPGVFRLPAGSRVGDLVAAAGGYGPRVDTARAEGELNLAATLQDGDRVRVPTRDDDPAVVSPEPATSGGTGGGGATAGGPLDLNAATQAELEELPGIGPATALKILSAREESPFTSVDELRSRGILGEKTFEKVRELVAVP